MAVHKLRVWLGLSGWWVSCWDRERYCDSDWCPHANAFPEEDAYESWAEAFDAASQHLARDCDHECTTLQSIDVTTSGWIWAWRCARCCAMVER